MGDAIVGTFKLMVGVIAALVVVALFGWCSPRTSAACRAHTEYAMTDSLRSAIATKHPECATVLFTVRTGVSQ